MVAVAIISLTMLGLSGLLIDSHRRTWREARDSTTLSQVDKQFARAMYYRRTQASALVGLMGAAIGIWPIFDNQARPWALLFYTAILLTACAWSMALAMLDIWATRRHFQRKRMEQLKKQVQATVEMASLGESPEAEGAG
jgi:hypothetical protein